MKKYLTERTEIAVAMNSGDYPVLSINMEDHKGFSNTDFAEGDKVRCEYYSSHYGRRYTQGRLQYSEGKFTISSNSLCLKAGFGYHDVLEMKSWAQSQIVSSGQPVIVIEEYPSQEACKVHMMRAGKKVEPFCSTAIELEEVGE